MWLPLTDYATKYKISVSTLRRRIKADDISYQFQDGKYYISDEPINTINTNLKFSPSLNLNENRNEIPKQLSSAISPLSSDLSDSASDEFLENLKRAAPEKLPSIKNEVGILDKNKNESLRAVTPRMIDLESEYYFKSQAESSNHMNNKNSSSEIITNGSADRTNDNITKHFDFIKNEDENGALSSGKKDFSEKISKIGNNEPILTAANKLLNELKKAYTQILHEKEEQITSLKEEVSDLRTLVKLLERENSRMKEYSDIPRV